MIFNLLHLYKNILPQFINQGMEKKTFQVKSFQTFDGGIQKTFSSTSVDPKLISGFFWDRGENLTSNFKKKQKTFSDFKAISAHS